MESTKRKTMEDLPPEDAMTLKLVLAADNMVSLLTAEQVTHWLDTGDTAAFDVVLTPAMDHAVACYRRAVEHQREDLFSLRTQQIADGTLCHSCGAGPRSGRVVWDVGETTFIFQCSECNANREGE